MTYGYVTPYRRPLSWKRFRNQGSEMLSDLNRQINDMRAENGELRDEVAHYDQELRELREQLYNQQMEGSNPAGNGSQNAATNNNRQQQYTGIGQGVLNRRGSRNSGSAQRQNSNTRNSNATSGTQKQSRQSVQNR